MQKDATERQYLGSEREFCNRTEPVDGRNRTDQTLKKRRDFALFALGNGPMFARPNTARGRRPSGQIGAGTAQVLSRKQFGEARRRPLEVRSLARGFR